jgi:hypothetical protein
MAGGSGLELDLDAREAGRGEGGDEPLVAEGVVGRLADEAHGTADDDLRVRELVLEGRQEVAQEGRDQVLEVPGAAEDARLGKAALREVALHGHDQAGVEGIVEIGLDGIRACRVARPPFGVHPEAEDGPEDLGGVVLQHGHAAVRTQGGDHAVRGAEIDADDGGHACDRRGRGAP